MEKTYAVESHFLSQMLTRVMTEPMASRGGRFKLFQFIQNMRNDTLLTNSCIINIHIVLESLHMVKARSERQPL